VSPTGTVNFGSVALGGTAERTFTVSNTGGGTLSGAASVSAPFSIVSGSPFTLGGVGATQAVIVRFKPTTAATVTTNLNFTAGGSAISSIVTGSGSTVVNSAAAPSLSLVVTGNPSTTAPYAVEAQTNRTSVRVRFYVNNVLFRTENIAKYCLFGGGDGGALCTTGRLGNGTRTVQAQLHDAVTGALLATTSKTIVEGTPSPTLTLVVTGMPSAGSPYAVQAQTTQTSGVRVRFYRNGTLVRTESVAKFCLFGGGDGATVPCNTGKFGTGTHAIEVRVHSTSNDALLAKANITIVEGP
jgi:hypothetical protein